LVDSDVVFRGFSSCEDSGGARLSQYFIVSRKKGGFVVFSVVSSDRRQGRKIGGFQEGRLGCRQSMMGGGRVGAQRRQWIGEFCGRSGPSLIGAILPAPLSTRRAPAWG
jgi:hypothetical protein